MALNFEASPAPNTSFYLRTSSSKQCQFRSTNYIAFLSKEEGSSQHHDMMDFLTKNNDLEDVFTILEYKSKDLSAKAIGILLRTKMSSIWYKVVKSEPKVRLMHLRA
ncbi:hypothetical protein L6452_14985 [Arctium lappa]|uniref:Uncharacterized protein n=1 Tax=Arctium lappa TaxID=4217 RepID=A0ACB9CMM3_ARCLA|nr:hypothetical protein L6452_14985 [Arctium lappa]